MESLNCVETRSFFFLSCCTLSFLLLSLPFPRTEKHDNNTPEQAKEVNKNINHGLRYCARLSPAAASKPATTAAVLAATAGDGSSSSSPKKGSASGSRGR